MLDNQSEPQLVTKILLHVFVRKLHNSLVSDTNDGGLKYASDEDDNIIISDYTLRSMCQSLLIMGWCSSIPEHRLRMHLDSGPIR